MQNKNSNLKELLQSHFDYKNFWPGQEDVINAVLSQDQTMAIMPTGAGKSLCYQLPALILDNLTLVISPLIALMKDQVDSLKENNISATFINSSLNKDEYNKRIKNILENKYKIVYIAPERFYNQHFLNILNNIKISLFAIDEAHCISEWGHDFRPSYLKLKDFIKDLKESNNKQLKVLAVTATATPEVKNDIISQLSFDNPKTFITGFKRENLNLGVNIATKYQKLEIILKLIKKHGSPSIIYAGTRNKVEEITSFLRDFDFPANGYHAGMDNIDRKKVHEDFMKGKNEIIVATNAFGMGIDKSDIRLIIHNDMPSTLEAYYQEIGRAGRDGKKSHCVLLYSNSDRYLNEFFLQGDNPSPQTIKETYRFILHQDFDELDPKIYATLGDIAQYITEPASEMAISTALKVLEREEYIKRMPNQDNPASVKTKKTFEEIKATIGSRAKVQLKIIESLVKDFNANQSDYINFSLNQLEIKTKLQKSSLKRGLNALSKSFMIDYNPPFLGRGIYLLKNEPLQINYQKLEEKRKNDLSKLNTMENYVWTDQCRHQYILNYFGEENVQESCSKMCNNCVQKISKPDKIHQKKSGGILDMYFKNK